MNEKKSAMFDTLYAPPNKIVYYLSLAWQTLCTFQAFSFSVYVCTDIWMFGNKLR